MSCEMTALPFQAHATAVGLKSDRTGFTKMRATALIIVQLLKFFDIESLCI